MKYLLYGYIIIISIVAVILAIMYFKNKDKTYPRISDEEWEDYLKFLDTYNKKKKK